MKTKYLNRNVKYRIRKENLAAGMYTGLEI